MVSLVHDRWFDYKHGVRTEGQVFLKDSGVKSDYLEKDQRHRGYKATRVRAFRKLMHALALPQENVFVDLGSGMGRILLLAMEYGFTKAVGVELSSDLCSIARDNIATYQKNCPTRTQVHIIETDVAAYKVNDDESVYFLFNPFSDEILGLFFENLRMSLQRRDREVWIIYNNPVYQEYIHSLDFIEMFCTFVYGGSTFHIYRHRVPGKNHRIGRTPTPSWLRLPQ